MVPPPTSSTFSSRRRLAWIFAPALALLAAYALAIRGGLVPATDGFQIRDKNRIKCERYLLDPAIKPNVVLVGSSLTANLPISDVAPRIFNLGLAGDCAWTGLELVRRRPDFHPAMVVIEASDLLAREADRVSLDSLLNPWGLAVRRALPMFRMEYQPAGVLLKAIGRWQKRRHGGAEANATAVTGAAPLPVTQHLLDQARAASQGGLPAEDATRMRAACARLRMAIAQFHAAGIRCVLQRVPGDATLDHTARHEQLDALLDAEFPRPQYAWTAAPADFGGRTWDAVHLVPTDASRYAQYLCAQLDH